MSFEEKRVWIYLAATVMVSVVYFVTVFGQLPSTAAAEIGYTRPLLIAIVAAVAVTVVATVVAAVASPREADQKDQRDNEINRYGEYVGFYVLSVGFLPALALTLAQVDYFWIANAIYAAYVVNAVTSSIVKIRAYRHGL